MFAVYVVHIKALKKGLNHGLVLKRVHRIIKFNEKAWLKPYIVWVQNLEKKKKKRIWKRFIEANEWFSFWKNNVKKNKVRNLRDIKLVTTDEKRSQLTSEPSYHRTKRFSENLLAMEMKMTKVIMNKPVYFGISILDIRKTVM